MRRSAFLVSLCLVVCAGIGSQRAMAGPFGDDMAKCLVKSASTEDRSLLIRWIFSEITLHPDLASMTSVTPAQRDELSRSAGALFQRLLIESCKTETQLAIKNEGAKTMEYAFQILGEVAMQGIISNPKVVAGVAEITKGVDQEKLKAALRPDPAS
jgi:hypothetical protein